MVDLQYYLLTVLYLTKYKARTGVSWVGLGWLCLGCFALRCVAWCRFHRGLLGLGLCAERPSIIERASWGRSAVV
jgi:hypothetical protein